MTFGFIEGFRVEVLDLRFNRIVPASARMERLWTGARWTEGPAWFPARPATPSTGPPRASW